MGPNFYCFEKNFSCRHEYSTNFFFFLGDSGFYLSYDLLSHYFTLTWCLQNPHKRLEPWFSERQIDEKVLDLCYGTQMFLHSNFDSGCVLFLQSVFPWSFLYRFPITILRRPTLFIGSTFELLKRDWNTSKS